MAVGCQQDEVWRQGLLGVGPYGGGGVGLAVEAGSQVIVAAAFKRDAELLARRIPAHKGNGSAWTACYRTAGYKSQDTACTSLTEAEEWEIKKESLYVEEVFFR